MNSPESIERDLPGTVHMRALVLLSGGLDSAVALFWALSRGWEVFPIEFEYFRRPKQERRACADLRRWAGLLRYLSVPLPFLREAGDVVWPEKVNDALREAPPGYIPSKNMIYYSLCAYYAEILDARYIVGGHTRADTKVFPDAGKEFWESLNRLIRLGMWSHAETGTEVVLPLIDLEKVEVVRLGRKLGVPFALTWSCGYDAERPCGCCPSCLERREAFDAAGVAGAEAEPGGN